MPLSLSLRVATHGLGSGLTRAKSHDAKAHAALDLLPVLVGSIGAAAPAVGGAGCEA
eukprot:CAMPEP_0118862062 /NCGR_PEP_ID=MMETSP1163-20130328/7392_1 /TAXON_ID=124430 /ORGANISM="Phaeomonas parva, Strain CCMP2877" /LENGTH=56 /DNA_ID=CAMNT_0006795929 /DNA_START=185 /DNA_END=355 /DNA_ORIENTATION=-